MKAAKTLSLAGLLAMSAVLVYAFSSGDFFTEGSQLAAMPWGIVSLVDLYTGFALFAGWIIYREKSWLHALLWALALMLLGFWTGSLYALVAAISSKGDWKKFWLGKHA